MKKVILMLMVLLSSISYSQDINGFYLSRYSPVIDMGTMDVYHDVQGMDFYGNPRFQGRSLDMGAAEFQDRWDRIVTANITADATIFRGDSIQLMASGGEIYNWNTGDSTRVITVAPQETTTYTVIVNEMGTIDTAEVTITVVDNLKPMANSGDDLVECSGISILLSVEEKIGNTYEWSTGDTTSSIQLTLTNDVLIWVKVSNGETTVTDYKRIYVNQNCSQ